MPFTFTEIKRQSRPKYILGKNDTQRYKKVKAQNLAYMGIFYYGGHGLIRSDKESGQKSGPITMLVVQLNT